jgi:hypothetical protein
MMDSAFMRTSSIGAAEIQEHKSDEQADYGDAADASKSHLRAGDHAMLPPQEDGSIRQADCGCGKQEYPMRRGEQGKATQPSRSQAKRGQHEGQTAARCHAKGGNQSCEGQLHGAGASCRSILGRGGKV